MLGPDDVGHRVVVRRVVGVRDGRPLFSDALGELTGLTDSELTMMTERGPLRVPLTRVARAKRVPPRRWPRPAEIIALEQAADEGWPAPERERLGGWLLRAAAGWTSRGNSALPIGDPGRPLGEAIDAVTGWYPTRGLPPAVNVPMPLAAPVNAALDARGWRTGPPVLVQTVPLAALVAATATAATAATPQRTAPPVRLTGTPSPGWLGIAAGRKGGLPDAALHILTAVPEVRFAEVYAGSGDLLAIGRGTVTGAGRFLGLTLIEVVPAARRRGLARHVVGALAGWAAQQDRVQTVFLQVEKHNTAAVALYRQLGFTTHHTYLPRTP